MAARVDLPADLREAVGRAAHAAPRVGVAGQMLLPGGDWPDLTEAAREEFRAQGDPALSVLAPLLADAQAEVARLTAELAASQARERALRDGLIHEAAELVRWACGREELPPQVKRAGRAWWEGHVDAIRRAGLRLRDIHDKTPAPTAEARRS